MKSAVVKRSVVIDGHKTSVSLEEEFFHSLKEIADEKRCTLSRLIREVDTVRRQQNLSSSLRLFVLDHYVKRLKALAEPPNAAAGAPVEIKARQSGS